MKFKIFLNRLAITIVSIVYNILNRFRSHKDTKNVLIIFQQIFGDSIVISSSLQAYVDYFVKEKGYKLTFLCRPVIAKFMKEILPIPVELNFETVDFKKLIENVSYYKNIVQKYQNYADIIIVPGSSISAEILSTSINAPKKIGLQRAFPLTWPPIMVLYKKLAYTNHVVPMPNEMMIQRHRRLLNYFGICNYKGKMPSLLPQKKLIDGSYCVICPGASQKLKCWPIERYAEIADFIVKNYNLNIHLCGGIDEEAFATNLIEKSKYKERIIDHVGKTTIVEWSSIVQHSSLVIGNDSATLHIAAAARCKSICIVGVFDKYQFFPYAVDVLEKGDFLPETILVDMPCEYCVSKGYFAGYGNSICKNKIKSGQCSLCIDKISVQQVKEKIKKLF
jgi:ADP-heptose:LPS heptosyltransferase